MSPHSIKPLPRLRGRRGGNTQRCGVRSKGRSLLSADNPHSTSTSILDHQLINVFYANITKWGRKAETFVSKDQSHIICMVEHHLDKLQFVDVARKISAWKRSAFVSYAKRTGLHANATSGGQFILPRSYLSCEAVDQSLLDHCIPAGERDCPRWTACILRTKSVSVLLVVLYLITAEGFSESNAAILQQVFTLVAVFRGVVIIGGDWQFPPSDLIVSPWLARLGLKVVCPAGLDATCSAGSGRLIDYFLATASLVQYIDIKPDVAVDFKPHIGLRLSFPARLRSLSAPALRVPRTLPTLPLADGEHQLDEALWKQAHDYTESYLQRRAAGTRILGCNMAMFRCMSVEDQRLSQEYCFVATRHEVYAALAGGVDSNDLVSYVGRGGFPHASIKPIVKRQTITSRYVCPACDLWGIIESLLQWVKRAAVSGVASMILKLAIVELRRQSARIGDHWTRVAAPNCPPSAWCDWIDGLTVDAVVNGDVAQMPPSYSQVVGVATAVKLPDPGEVQNSTSSPRGGAEFHCYPKPSSGRETDPPAPFAGEKLPDPRGGAEFHCKAYKSARVDVWISRAAAQKHKAFAAKTSATRYEFRRWLREDLASGASGAHKLVKDQVSYEKLDYQDTFGQWAKVWHSSNDVSEASSSHGGKELLFPWQPWQLQLLKAVQRACGDSADSVNAIRSVRRECLQRNVVAEPIQVEQFASAVSTYPAKKGVGIDFWSTRDFKRSPNKVLEPFAAVLNAAQTALSWPVQIMFNVMALLPKPQGGERTVAKTPLLYRLYNVVRAPAVKEWAVAHCEDHDFAAQGKSALLSAAHRCWTNEMARHAKLHSASILWDIWKFFDSIRPQDVIREGARMQYPMVDLVMALLMHTAARMLQLNGMVSYLMVPTCSILAGCFHAVFMARLVMTSPVSCMAREYKPPLLRVSTFVDDVAQISIGKLKPVLHSAVAAALRFVSGMKTLRLKVSSKSVVVSTSERVTTIIAKLVHKYAKVNVRTDNAARDLGVLNNPGSKRVRDTSLQYNRLQKAGRRLGRIAPLARSVRAARTLARTGALPQAVWGATVLGLSPTALSRLRTQFAAATGVQAAGRCATTAIALAVGPMNDPAIKLVLDQVTLFTDLWRYDASLRALTVRHWNALVTSTLGEVGEQEVSVWNRVGGPVSATVAALTDYGWDVRSNVRWADPSGEQWIPDFSQDRADFLNTVAQFALSKLWSDASKSWCGAGLQHGVDWRASSMLHKHLLALRRSSGDDDDMGVIADVLEDSEPLAWPQHSLTWLEVFVTGGYWPSQRASQALGISALCPRCGRHNETALHCIWTCPMNAEISDPRVVETQELIPQAVEGAADLQCLWLRGLLPASLVPVNTPAVMSDEVWYVRDHPAGWWPAGVYYTDCSGGPHNIYPPIRRCGIGVAVLDMHHDLLQSDPQPFVWGAYAPLPGLLQTVPRGELYAMVLVVERVLEGNLEIRSDSKVNVDLFHKGRQACLASSNSDLWLRLWDVLGSREVCLEMIWVKGHTDDVDVANRYLALPIDIFGNSCADRLAERASIQYQVSMQDSMTLRWHYAVVKRIQARAVIILSHVMQGRARVAAAPKQPRPQLQTLAASAMQSQHCVTALAGILQCTRCLQRSPARAKGIREWLRTSCCPDRSMLRSITVGTTKPAALSPGTVVHVGKRELHTSHSLHVFRGLYFCQMCGYTASLKAQNLVKPCSGPGPEAEGIKRAIRIRQGKLPSGLTQWPNDAEARSSLIYLD